MSFNVGPSLPCSSFKVYLLEYMPKHWCQFKFVCVFVICQNFLPELSHATRYYIISSDVPIFDKLKDNNIIDYIFVFATTDNVT
jgi:hypothetical protein